MSLDISQYVTLNDQGMQFSQTQANHFAKGVAGDFNPIHDIGGKRFCVPGDLLFAALLNRYGVYEQLTVDLMALVNADVIVRLPEQLQAANEIRDANDRHLLSLDVAGQSTADNVFVTNLVEQYVKFSGKTFPDILVDLMRDKNVMINPARPLVIYKDMSIQLDRLIGEDLSLSLDNASMDVDGKKGKACLRFIIKSGSDIIGRGEKNMLLSGLREYDEAAMSDIVSQYTEWKSAYKGVETDAM